MPWFPDFVSAVELARQQTRAAGQADPVAQYLTALNKGDTHLLEDAWPGEVVVYDPRAGEIRGHRELRRFVSHNLSWLAGLHARTETVARTVIGGRAVVELQAHLDHHGRELAWPVAVVRWGRHDLPPQAGLGVYERGPDGLLAAARVYDDIEPPAPVAP